MDPNGHIYMDEENRIPEGDKARLDGFLRGRSESDAMRKETEEEMKRKTEELEAKLAAFREEPPVS